MTSVAPRSEGKKLRYYVIVDSSEEVISPGSPLVTQREQRCFTYFKLLELKREREKCDINKETPPNPALHSMIPHQESDFDSSRRYDTGGAAKTSNFVEEEARG